MGGSEAGGVGGLPRMFCKGFVWDEKRHGLKMSLLQLRFLLPFRLRTQQRKFAPLSPPYLARKLRVVVGNSVEAGVAERAAQHRVSAQRRAAVRGEEAQVQSQDGLHQGRRRQLRGPKSKERRFNQSKAFFFPPFIKLDLD